MSDGDFNMSFETFLISIFTAAVTAALVAGVNHFWNRRYLLLVEREKYRQTLFSEKFKAYIEITTAIHDFTAFAGKESARFEINKTDDVFQKMTGIYSRLMDVNSIIHKYMILIPEGTLDNISDISEMFHKVVKITEARDAINRIEILVHSLHSIVDVLRDDLGIEEFGNKLNHKLFQWH